MRGEIVAGADDKDAGVECGWGGAFCAVDFVVIGDAGGCGAGGVVCWRQRQRQAIGVGQREGEGAS